MRLRLAVFRSNKAIYAQIIDDSKGKTLVSVNEKELLAGPEKKSKSSKINETVRIKNKLTKTEKAKLLGELLAKKATRSGLKEVYFDRGDYKYHGRIKALAEGARKGGLVF